MTTYYSLSHRPNSVHINGLSPRTNIWSNLSPRFIRFQEVVKTYMLFHKIQNWIGVIFFIRGNFRKCFNSVHHKLLFDHLVAYINKLTLPFPTELAYFQAQLLQSIHKIAYFTLQSIGWIRKDRYYSKSNNWKHESHMQTKNLFTLKKTIFFRFRLGAVKNNFLGNKVRVIQINLFMWNMRGRTCLIVNN